MRFDDTSLSELYALKSKFNNFSKKYHYSNAKREITTKSYIITVA